jgi:drug/metabolite transporter (DMT)-like permease
VAIPSHSQNLEKPAEQPGFNTGLGFKRLASQGVLVSIVLNTAGQLLFKSARMAQPDASLVGMLFSIQTWTALGVYALSALCWLWVLSRVQLSFAYPLLSLTFPVVVGLSAACFGEPVSLIQWIGVGIVVVGVSLLART